MNLPQFQFGMQLLFPGDTTGWLPSRLRHRFRLGPGRSSFHAAGPCQVFAASFLYVKYEMATITYRM
jgi:hypothetical protein